MQPGVAGNVELTLAGMVEPNVTSVVFYREMGVGEVVWA